MQLCGCRQPWRYDFNMKCPPFASLFDQIMYLEDEWKYLPTGLKADTFQFWCIPRLCQCLFLTLSISAVTQFLGLGNSSRSHLKQNLLGHSARYKHNHRHKCKHAMQWHTHILSNNTALNSSRCKITNICLECLLLNNWPNPDIAVTIDDKTIIQSSRTLNKNVGKKGSKNLL